MKEVLVLLSLICLVSCSKTESVQEKEQTKTFRTSFLEIEIPQSYSVDSADHWDKGRSYFLNNKRGETVMTIRSGLNSVYALNQRTIYSTEEFSVNNKIDTNMIDFFMCYLQRLRYVD